MVTHRRHDDPAGVTAHKERVHLPFSERNWPVRDGLPEMGSNVVIGHEQVVGAIHGIDNKVGVALLKLMPKTHILDIVFAHPLGSSQQKHKDAGVARLAHDLLNL